MSFLRMGSTDRGRGREHHRNHFTNNSGSGSGGASTRLAQNQTYRPTTSTSTHRSTSHRPRDHPHPLPPHHLHRRRRSSGAATAGSTTTNPPFTFFSREDMELSLKTFTPLDFEMFVLSRRSGSGGGGGSSSAAEQKDRVHTFTSFAGNAPGREPWRADLLVRADEVWGWRIKFPPLSECLDGSFSSGASLISPSAASGSGSPAPTSATTATSSSSLPASLSLSGKTAQSSMTSPTDPPVAAFTSPVLLCTASLALMTELPKGAELAIRFEIGHHSQALAPYSRVYCKSRFFDDGRAGNEGEARVELEDGGRGAKRLGTVPFLSEGWAGKIVEMAKLLREAKVLREGRRNGIKKRGPGDQDEEADRNEEKNAIEQAEDLEERVRAVLKRFTAVQEVSGVVKDDRGRGRDGGEDKVRLMTILWKFECAAPGEAGATTWRRVALKSDPKREDGGIADGLGGSVGLLSATGHQQHEHGLEHPQMHLHDHHHHHQQNGYQHHLQDPTAPDANDHFGPLSSLPLPHDQDFDVGAHHPFDLNDLSSLAFRATTAGSQGPHDMYPPLNESNDIDFTGGHIQICMDDGGVGVGMGAEAGMDVDVDPGVAGEGGYGDLGVGVVGDVSSGHHGHPHSHGEMRGGHVDVSGDYSQAPDDGSILSHPHHHENLAYDPLSLRTGAVAGADPHEQGQWGDFGGFFDGGNFSVGGAGFDVAVGGEREMALDEGMEMGDMGMEQVWELGAEGGGNMEVRGVLGSPIGDLDGGAGGDEGAQRDMERVEEMDGL
ncbi:hypothetical protein K402DRAFT_104288 [Aulographum hederae CBS 113979]|uniref:Uncharacterized protein n=1 Tax=Aulographum hederae CBS 113979 TaxID=1176131 RepID=A0A6G1GXV2_9PEZI|nr:hypothetical protein K402DRAFT_104288 [Aulographum hederae CBS 113979]